MLEVIIVIVFSVLFVISVDILYLEGEIAEAIKPFAGALLAFYADCIIIVG